MVGTGMGAKGGILLRDIDALQHAEEIDTVVLDKTGTLTQGKPAVVVPITARWRAAGRRGVAAGRLGRAGQCPSPGQSLGGRGARPRPGFELPPARWAQSSPARGMSATVEGRALQVGSASWMAQVGAWHAAPEDWASGMGAPPMGIVQGQDAQAAAHTWVWLAQPGHGAFWGRCLWPTPSSPTPPAQWRRNCAAWASRSVLLTGDHDSAAGTVHRPGGRH